RPSLAGPLSARPRALGDPDAARGTLRWRGDAGGLSRDGLRGLAGLRVPAPRRERGRGRGRGPPVTVQTLARGDDALVTVTAAERWLVVRFAVEQAVASWAIVGGGLRRARSVAWHEIADRELGPAVDAAELLRERLAARGLDGGVGFL